MLHSGTAVNFDHEPFINYGQHTTDRAYPHAGSLLPVSLPFDLQLLTILMRNVDSSISKSPGLIQPRTNGGTPGYSRLWRP